MISVLVVDDDRTVRETLADFFDTLGYAARTAATASEGRRAAAEHAPDLVLVDIRLPDASGLALLETLRADDPERGVIMLTGRSDVPTAVRAMKAGALDFLQKPIDLETLDAAVTRAAELVRLRREVSMLRAQRTFAVAPVNPTTLAEAERRAIGEALRVTAGNKVHAAKLLGIARSTLLEKLKRLKP
jgi:DNA-binding NtrC family response regulator